MADFKDLPHLKYDYEKPEYRIDPMEPLIEEIVTDFRRQHDANIMKAVADVGIVVDKPRLMKALTDAKAFYEEGYRAAMNRADVVEIPQSGIGDLSDGYHTFNELYHHRAILFSVICNSIPDKAWKSKLHDTGDMFDGMFIVGIETPKGQATYHYDINPYWDMFKVKELEKAPKWDGHTPQEAIDRISTLVADVVEIRHGECPICSGKKDIKQDCNNGYYVEVDREQREMSMWLDDECLAVFSIDYCPNCGADMRGEKNGT